MLYDCFGGLVGEKFICKFKPFLFTIGEFANILSLYTNVLEICFKIDTGWKCKIKKDAAEAIVFSIGGLTSS